MPTPTVRRLQLGNELRRVREAAGKTPAEAARLLGSNASKISRLELGQSGIAIGDVKLLLEFYGDEPAHIEWMMNLARNNRERGRWTGYRAAFPEWFRTYVDLERDAEDIRWTEIELVPGLLQTENYTRALHADAQPFGAAPGVDSLVRALLERQEVLDRADPPTVNFIMSESCVRRFVGGRAIMIEQLEHLAELSMRPRIQLQVLPFDTDPRDNAGLPIYRFTLLRIPAPGVSSSLVLVYIEDMDDARYIDDKRSVRIYEALWGRMQAAALGPAETLTMLEGLIKQLK